MESVKDPSRLLDVDKQEHHLERPGFRIAELTINPTQKVPWHYHSNTQDTFYVLEGLIRLFLREPKEEIRLAPGETYSVRPRRPPSGYQRRTDTGDLPGFARYRRVRLRPAGIKRKFTKRNRVVPASVKYRIHHVHDHSAENVCSAIGQADQPRAK